MLAHGDAEHHTEAGRLVSGGTEADVRVLLTAPHWEVRRDALRRLGELSASDWPALLVAALTDRAGGVRRYAADSLCRLAGNALEELQRHLDDPVRGPTCAAVMACCLPGRALLARRDDRGLPLLLASFQSDCLYVRARLAVIKALVIIPSPAVGDCLAALLTQDSVLLRNAAGRALEARCDDRATEYVCQRLYLFAQPDLDTLAWLAEHGDLTAMPALQRFSSRWRSFWASRRVHEAATAAMARLRERGLDVPAGAISRAAPPDGEPTAAALSLWREDDPDVDEAS